MTTGRLLWGMTWRGTVWGILYSLAFSLLTRIVAQVWNSSPVSEQIRDLNSFSNLGQNIVVILVAGLLWDGIIGTPLRLLLGTIGGFSLGVFTRIFYFPISKAQVYRFFVNLSSGIAGFAWELGTMLVIFFTVFHKAFEKQHIFFTSIMFLVPSIITGVASVYISDCLARWYERESAKGNAQNVPSN